MVRDMLAFNMINEFEIFCTNKGCEWRGKLEEISFHMPNCRFAEGKIPDWYVTYMKSKEVEMQKQELEEELLVKDEMSKALG